MKNNIKSVVVLTAICLVVSVILAGVNFITAPVIAENDEKASNASLAVVMPEGGSFEGIDITAFELPATVIGAFKAENGGHVIKLSASGYGSDMIIMCGVNAEGTITGTAAQMFSIAGPVIVFGTASSLIAGIIYYFIR